MKRFIKGFFLLLVIGGAAVAGFAWYTALRENVVEEQAGYELRIPRGAGFDHVVRELEGAGVLDNMEGFQLTAKIRRYVSNVKPGLYIIPAGMNNWDLVGKLRSGDQDELKLRFGSHWTLEEVAEEIGAQLMLDKETIYDRMQDEDFLAKYDANRGTVRNLFVPNTYFVYWTVSEEDLFAKFKRSYDEYWNDERREKAENLGMNPHQVTTLASIVQAETYRADERPRVAGLYLNRLRDGIPLQADPTIIFANNDFTIRRVLNRHLEVDSPYNTYKYRGLPPGPINNPEPTAIDAVLNAENHKYIFMCAKPDFSGYHNFARTNAEHERNARAYRKALRELDG